MTGPEHYAEAERLLSLGAERGTVGETDRESEARQRRNAVRMQRAQVHATLALAAATAESLGFRTGPWHEAGAW